MASAGSGGKLTWWLFAVESLVLGSDEFSYDQENNAYFKNIISREKSPIVNTA